MKDSLGTLLVVGLLACPALAKDTVDFLIPSSPPGATVYKDNSAWGVTGSAFSVKKSKLPRGNLNLRLAKKNYEDYSLVISSFEIQNSRGEVVKFPRSPVVLTPLYFWVPLVENPGPLLWIGLGFLAIGAVVGRNFQLRRASHLREQQVGRLREKIAKQHEFALHKIGHYRLLDLLGEGGIARVYRAVPDSTLDEADTVAVKILHPHLSKEGDHTERFIREGAVSKDLIHPNIVRLFEIDKDGDVVYLVLELLHGVTLKEKMKEGELTLAFTRQIVQQILDGLVYAHGQGVIHRDLTPSNVMIGSGDVVKLMDFGLARRQEVGHTITVTGVIQGTPGYMAPEQLTETVDARTDQYSLGVIMFEMLTGRRPIERSDPMQLIMATFSDDAPDPREFNSSIPEPIAQLLLRLLRRDPKERFATMEEAADAFGSAFRSAHGYRLP